MSVMTPSCNHSLIATFCDVYTLNSPLILGFFLIVSIPTKCIYLSTCLNILVKLIDTWYFNKMKLPQVFG